VRVACAERLPVRVQFGDVEGHQADAQLCGDAAGRQLGPLHGVVQARVDRLQVVAELPADLGQAHRAAGAGEEFGADAPLLLLDGLADACLGDVQPLRGPAEVQLLGQHQEDLDVPQLHRPRPFLDQ
jgi:hypothetical protein